MATALSLHPSKLMNLSFIMVVVLASLVAGSAAGDRHRVSGVDVVEDVTDPPVDEVAVISDNVASQPNESTSRLAFRDPY